MSDKNFHKWSFLEKFSKRKRRWKLINYTSRK